MSDPRVLVGAIDQGTSSSRVIIFDRDLKEVCKHKIDIGKSYPNEGWFEQDPAELIQSVRACLEKVGEALPADGKLVGVGVTNQRETTILWDKNTGKQFCPAVVWSDGRTGELVEKMVAETSTKSKDHFRPRCGLPIDPYFSALKIKWLIENNQEVREAIQEERCLFGTVDSWIIWNLTGGPNGGVHVTDVTNACRTMLMNIHKLEWDSVLCNFFGIPKYKDFLPEIKSSSEIYGYISEGPLKGVPLCGCIGDQQAALVGHQCFKRGDAKNTYGTGCFLICNTGQEAVMSQHGLLTTIAYQLGSGQPVTYALEGSILTAGQTVEWLEENLEFFKGASEIEALANKVDSTGGVYFVPAFSGLYAPHWRPDARGLMIGLTNSTRKEHICRAALEAVCFQSREILDAMNRDLRLQEPLKKVRVDGGMTENELLLQIQANILGIEVVKPEITEMTAAGAAITAGLAAGVWSSIDKLPPLTTFGPYESKLSTDEMDARFSKWKEAVERCKGWAVSEEDRKKESRNGKTTLVFSLGVITGAMVSSALLLALRRS